MKIKYSKPDIVFEGFSLSTSIAGTCTFQTGTDLQAARQRGVDYGGVMLFLNGMDKACDVQVEDGSPAFDSLCYHVPTSMTALFNSN